MIGSNLKLIAVSLIGLSLSFNLYADTSPANTASTDISSNVKTVVVKPKGEFTTIDTAKTIAVTKALKSASSETKDNAVKEVLKNPNEYAPPALFLVSEILFKSGKKEDAMFWFYTAQLRTRSDVNKSEDPSTAATAQQLTQQFGGPINQYAMKNIPLLKKVVANVIEYDKTHQRNYDPRWIALSGLKSYSDEKVAFKPRNQWAKIDKDTRENYYKDFLKAVKQIQSQ